MITDNYIKLCEQADEIQKEWKPKYGDLTLWKDIKGREIPTYITDRNLNDFWIESCKRYEIYLPTQEQLQEMVFPNTKRYWCEADMIYALKDWVD